MLTAHKKNSKILTSLTRINRNRPRRPTLPTTRIHLRTQQRYLNEDSPRRIRNLLKKLTVTITQSSRTRTSHVLPKVIRSTRNKIKRMLNRNRQHQAQKSSQRHRHPRILLRVPRRNDPSPLTMRRTPKRSHPQSNTIQRHPRRRTSKRRSPRQIHTRKGHVSMRRQRTFAYLLRILIQRPNPANIRSLTRTKRPEARKQITQVKRALNP